MPCFVVSPAAERDIESILAWTHERFGASARLRYEALLVRAILDVADDAGRVGSRNRPEIATAARTYHLAYSRDHVDAAVGRVRHPRHLLLYRIGDDDRIEIGRVLHDNMDLSRHLPGGYGSTVFDEKTSGSP